MYPINVPVGSLLVLEESAYNPFLVPTLPNSPTSWFWNIRIGEKLQLNNAGPWYTVVGPMTQSSAMGNSELFVNVGPPGTRSPLARFNGVIVYHPEFLLLVNGVDDNANGWTDEGWDGIDNNGDGQVDELAEWETEIWTGASLTQNITNVPYLIRRSPAPAPAARAVALPTQMVVDLTTWSSTRERSRLPVNVHTGYVDIMVNPDGSLVPMTIYSTPASFGLGSAFLHFWLAERSDLAAPSPTVTAAPYLPLPQGLAPTRFNGLELKGENRLVTLFARTGQVTTNENPPFDTPVVTTTGTASTTAYNPNLPFQGAQQGVSGRQ